MQTFVYNVSKAIFESNILETNIIIIVALFRYVLKLF